MAFGIIRVSSWLLGFFQVFSWLLVFFQVIQFAFEICQVYQLAFGKLKRVAGAFVFEKYQVSCFWCVLRQCILNQFGSDAKRIVISDLKIFLKNIRNVLFTRFSCVELICLLNAVNLSSL